MGVAPSVSLFCYFFSPKVDNNNRSGSFTWRLRNGMRREYLGGWLITHWPEWRQDWCWIKMPDRPAFCALPEETLEPKAAWGRKIPFDERLALPI